MSNEIKIFESKEFGNVRVVMQENEPWFMAKDVCDILKYKNHSDAIKKHVDEDDIANRYPITDSLGRTQLATIINESGLYSLILRSNMTAAKKFKKWVTGDVLPSIRKSGGYMLDTGNETPEELFARALKLADETLKRREMRIKNLELENTMQGQQITELKPKASYYDVVLQCKELLTITQIAKDYGMSAVKMNKILKDMCIQFKQSGQWLLYQKYAEGGYTQSKTQRFVRKDGTDGIALHTYWTQKGRLFLYDLLKSEYVLPLIEVENK